MIPSPLAQPELGVVKKNDDPDGQGRVRVQLHWQEQDTMTDWIQVMSPDGGSSDKVAKNRGFVFIPEVGDLVMVAYRDGNCDAPFRAGQFAPRSGFERGREGQQDQEYDLAQWQHRHLR